MQRLKQIITPRKLFLADSMGALLSAIMLGFVLTRFEAIFGMPVRVLSILSFIAAIFAVYSFLCFLIYPRNWQSWLKAIGIANLSYGCITLVLCIYFRNVLLFPGMIYFALELLVIAILARIELDAAASSRK